MMMVMTETQTKNLISDESKAEIDRWIAKFPADQKRSAVLQALTIVQEQNGGWLTDELMKAVANYLELPHIAVFEIATFYSMYDMEPVGRHKIYLCTNISCLLCGSEKIEAHLKQKLGVGFGETTADGKFTLKEVECLGACRNAPMMQIDKTYYENLTEASVDEILAELE